MFPQTERMTAGRQRAAQAVAVRRGKLGMTQQDLAREAKVDAKTIGNLETRGKWPIARTRARIEEALGWPDGEMTRLAADGDGPLVPPEVAAAIGRAYRDDPDKAREAISALEAIERERRGARGEARSPGEQNAG
jgi:transcriptional regulator with XRE-family HTH domain